MIKGTVQKIIILGIVFGILPFTAHAQNDSWLPAPTGPYGVGRVSYHWVDEAREETATSDPDDKRELVVRVWYPADVDEDAVLAPYIEDAVGPMSEEWVSGIEEGWGWLRPDTESIEFQDYIGPRHTLI